MERQPELAEAHQTAEPVWGPPLTVWRGLAAASHPQRRWFATSAVLFALGILVWIGLAFVPRGALPPGWWLLIPSFFPILTTLAFGATFLAMAMRPVPQAPTGSALEYVENLSLLVRALSASERDELAARLASGTEEPSSDLSANVMHLVSAARDGEVGWRTILHRLLECEDEGIWRRPHRERLLRANPEDRQRARFAPALLAFAVVVCFAPVIGLIVVPGPHQFPFGLALLTTPLMVLVIVCVVMSLYVSSYTSRQDRPREIADALRN